MTARILGRWAHLLLRCPQASAASSRLQAATAQRAGTPWPLAWARPAAKPLCLGHRLPEEEQPSIKFKLSELDELVKKAGTPEAVLQLWAERGGSANQAGLCLIHISRLALKKDRAESANLLQDPRCVDMLETVNSQISVVWNGMLVSLLHSLSTLGLLPSTPVMQSLQTEALWRLRRLTYRQLAYLADWVSARHSQGQGNEMLSTTLLKQLELRWTELDNPRTLATLMARAGALSSSLMDSLEDKVLELAEKFSAEDIRKVALALSSQRRRSVPVLRALSYHLREKPSSELQAPLLLDMAFAYSKLNFHHTPMLERMSSELLPWLPELSPADVMRWSKALALLKWLHLPLFEGFAQHFMNGSESYSTLQLSNLILSFARLNFQPTNREKFYKKVHEALRGSWLGLEPFLLTDMVWSLCVLQQAVPDYIAAVTDTNFHTKLTEGAASHVVSYKLKLLQIAASRQLEPLGAPGECPPAGTLSAVPVKAGAHTALQRGLHAAVQTLAENRTSALRTNVSTVYGWVIDAELVLDAENKPVDLENLVAPHLPGGGGADLLPQGAHRMAFLAWEFSHFCCKSKDLLGRFAMQKRHLQLAGFLVVEVPYFDWLELKFDWQKVSYLKDKMGHAVAEEMAK